MQNSRLLEGALTRLTAINPESDAQAFTNWQRDTEYWRLLDSDPPHLPGIKQTQEWMEKTESENRDFAIRTRADDKLIGFCGMHLRHGPHRDTFIYIGIGERDYRGKGYGTDAHGVLLHYAFTELDLHRVSLSVFGYNERAIRSYEKLGYVREGVQRQELLRNGRRWDSIMMGLLASEWRTQSSESSVPHPDSYPL